MSEPDKNLPMDSMLNSSGSDSDSSNEDLMINIDTKNQQHSGAMKNMHNLTNCSLLIKLGLNAFVQAQDQLNTFCRSNNVFMSLPENWESIVNVNSYLTPQSESSTPYRMDVFDEAIESSLRNIKTKHHIKAPFTTSARTFICDTIRKAKDNLKKQFSHEELYALTKDYKPYAKNDDPHSKLYRDTVDDIYKTFLNQGITTLTPKNINNKIKKSLTNQQSYKRTRENKNNDEEKSNISENNEVDSSNQVSSLSHVNDVNPLQHVHDVHPLNQVNPLNQVHNLQELTNMKQNPENYSQTMRTIGV